MSNSPVQARFNAILGSLAKIRPETSIGDDQRMLIDALVKGTEGDKDDSNSACF